MKEKLSGVKNLSEAVKSIFDLELNIDLESRFCMFTQEAMNGEVTEAYNQLGKKIRAQTYHNIAEDFRNRTDCYAVNHAFSEVGTIVDVGCGSGLLSLVLAELTCASKIIGIDLSEDMINLANENLRQKSNERKEEIKEFWKKLPQCCEKGSADYELLERHPPLLEKIKYIVGSVYDLPGLVGKLEVNYIVCRNALHRFKNPKLVLQNMYDSLSPIGKIYLRDLRRDADWKIILERIGEERWQHPILVKDYIGAMAGMLTMKEVSNLLDELGIINYQITDGHYELSEKTTRLQTMKEYAVETEYVCLISKK